MRIINEPSKTRSALVDKLKTALPSKKAKWAINIEKGIFNYTIEDAFSEKSG